MSARDSWFGSEGWGEGVDARVGWEVEFEVELGGDRKIGSGRGLR